jgi:membrane-associated phospholipid phosphatase
MPIMERRQGGRIDDPLLALFAPRDVTWLTFGLVYGGLLATLISLAPRPQRLMLAIQSYAFMVALRMTAIWLTPLEPPTRMIPLQDPFIHFFTHGQVLTKDLFFSGHTASMFLCYLVAPSRPMKILLLLFTFGVAACVLVQHVHYAIDVMAAPAFSLAAVMLARRARQRLDLPEA